MFEMFELPLDEEILQCAKIRAKNQRANKNSFERGKGNFVGYVGEYAVKKFLGLPFEPSTKDYDFILDGKRYEVKTKKTKYEVLPHYEGSVDTHSAKQDCDYYLFCRAIVTVPDAGIDQVFAFGYFPKKSYMKKAKFRKKGERDESNGWTVKKDCFNLEYQLLKPFSKLVKMATV
jgi:hypothetical protein